MLEHDEFRRLARCPARPRGGRPCRASPCPRARAPAPSCRSAWRARAPARRDRSGVQTLGGQVAEVLGERHAFGDALRRARARASALRMSALSRHASVTLRSARAGALPCGFSSRRSGTTRFARDDHGLLRAPLRVAAVDVERGEMELGVGRAGRVRARASRPRSLRDTGVAPNSASRPRPTSSTRSAATPATLCSSSVVPLLPSMSPRRTRSGEIALRQLRRAARRRRRACAIRTRRRPRSRSCCGPAARFLC